MASSTGSETGKLEEIDRHCAFCRILIKFSDVNRCAKCHRRAYCGRKCQSQDWKSKGNGGKGQGHKDWCGLSYGEEDLDFVVAPIPGKGRGIIAKRFFPAKARIMVDGFSENCMNDIFADAFESCRSLKQSFMFNHACDNNSDRFPDPDYKVMVVHAKRDIQIGDELTVNYTNINAIFLKVPPAFSYRSAGINRDGYFPHDNLQDARNLLEAKWRIVCSPSCFCRTEGLDNLLENARKKIGAISSKNAKGTKDVRVNLYLVSSLLEKCDQLRASWLQKGMILKTGFRFAVQQKETLPLAMKYIEEAHDIFTNIFHPEGRWGKKTEKLRKTDK